MTPSVFYDQLEGADWSYAMSDDPRAYRAGARQVDELYSLARKHGYLALYRDYVTAIRTGGPKPPRPAEHAAS